MQFLLTCKGLDFERIKCLRLISERCLEAGRHELSARFSFFKWFLQSGSSGKVKLLTGSDFDEDRSKPTTPLGLVD